MDVSEGLVEEGTMVCTGRQNCEARLGGMSIRLMDFVGCQFWCPSSIDSYSVACEAFSDCIKFH